MEHSNCNKAYLAKLSAVMSAGMSLRITYWGGEAQTMAWMDVPPCGGAGCKGSNAGDAVISNIEIKAGGSVDHELVWVVWDPEDKLYGTIAPRSVVADPQKFASLHEEGIATWDGARHFLRQMPRSSVIARLKEARAAGAGSGSSLNCDDPESPCDMSIGRDNSYFNTLLAKYTPLATPLSASSLWPLHVVFFLGMALMVGAAAFLVLRRAYTPHRAGNVTPPKKEPGPPPAFVRASPSSRPSSSANLAPPKSPSPPSPPSQHAKALPIPGGEGPSPMRRSRSSQLMTPPRMGSSGSRQELLSLLESAAE